MLKLDCSFKLNGGLMPNYVLWSILKDQPCYMQYSKLLYLGYSFYSHSVRDLLDKNIIGTRNSIKCIAARKIYRLSLDKE